MDTGWVESPSLGACLCSGIMRYFKKILYLLVMVPGLNAGFVQADTFSADGAFDSVVIYAGQGANLNLLELPGRIMTRDLALEKTYFAALGFGKVHGTLGQSVESLRGTAFESFRHGYETVLVQHAGLQSNAEVGAAYMLKTPDVYLWELGVNFGAGVGLSYALGTPSYDDGAKNDRARRHHMQLLALFDFEWHLAGFDNLSVITRVHHRSGAYGLIAPRHVGSNFLAVGVCHKF